MSDLRKDLRAMCADGAAWSAMVGIGESYLPAFVLALSASQLACGLVATVPMLAGAILQLASPELTRRFGSYRTSVVVCAVIQAVAFLPLVAMALLGRLSLVLMFSIVSIYWAAGLATAPAWNAWVETLVPRRLRARFFARRAGVGQVGLLLGFAAGGLLLETGARSGNTSAIFAILFFAAALSRLISAYFLNTQREPTPPGFGSRTPERGSLLGSLRSNLNSRVLRFMLAMQLAVWIAAPYFTPYMFTHLRLSYAGFMGLTCAALLSKILFFPAIGRLCDRFGTTRVLWFSGILITPLPAMWILSNSYAYLLGLQVLSGAAWAAFQLAMFLLLFETIPRSERIGTLTTYNLVNAAALAAGSLVGGALLSVLGAVHHAYLVLFVVSSAARVVSLLLLAQIPAISLKAWRPATRSLALRPSLETLERPVLPSLEGLDEETIPQPGAPTRCAA